MNDNFYTGFFNNFLEDVVQDSFDFIKGILFRHGWKHLFTNTQSNGNRRAGEFFIDAILTLEGGCQFLVNLRQCFIDLFCQDFRRCGQAFLFTCVKSLLSGQFHFFFAEGWDDFLELIFRLGQAVRDFRRQVDDRNLVKGPVKHEFFGSRHIHYH